MSDATMNGDLSGEDAATINRLGQAIQDTNMVPPWLSRFAKESHRLLRFEGELAEITMDSLLDEPVGSRSGNELRTIEFRAGDTLIRIEVEGAILRGSITPTPTAVSLATTSGQEPIQVNDRGFFTVPLPTGPFRLLVERTGAPIRTVWVNLS